MKILPNLITMSRIILSVVILFTEPFHMMFYIIYSICAVSDMLDGMIARKTKTESNFGAKLDSAADMVLLAVLILVLYPRVQLTTGIILAILTVAMVRLASIIIVARKYKTFAILHTLGNKAAGLMVFLLPYCLLLLQMEVLMYLCCLVAGLSAVEELMIHLMSDKLEINRRGVFFKN